MKTKILSSYRLSTVLALCFFCPLAAGLAQDLPPSAKAKAEKTAHVAPGLSVPTDPLGRLSVAVFAQQMIYVKSKNAQVLLMIKQGPNSTATFRYRMKTEKSKKEISGKGRLGEKYSRNMDDSGKINIQDEGSSLTIQLADIAIEWSHGSHLHSYIYYFPANCNIHLLNAGAFDRALFEDL